MVLFLARDAWANQPEISVCTTSSVAAIEALCYLPGMPYLNWKERVFGHSMEHPLQSELHSRARMELQFNQEELQLLVAQLEEIFFNGGHELRMDLPEGWIVFWKSRESGSRLLLAHPQEKEWVATAALEVELGKKWTEKLKNLLPGHSLSVNEVSVDLGIELFGPGSVSNVEIKITHL